MASPPTPLTLGSFLDFPGRANRGNTAWCKIVPRVPVEEGSSLGPELNLFSDCEKAIQPQASFISFKKM